MLTHFPLMQRAASFAPQSFNADDNSVEMVWTTGATVRRRVYSFDDGVREFDEQLIVEPSSVRLDRLNSGAPFLDSHRQWGLSNVIGSVVPGSARLSNGIGTARVMLSRAPEDAAVVKKIQAGIIRNVSTGYRIHKADKPLERDGQVPLVRIVDWEPHELSAVPVNADAAAQIRSDDDGPVYPCLIVGPLGNSAAFKLRLAMRQRMTLA